MQRVDGVNQTGPERWRRDGALPHPPLRRIDDLGLVKASNPRTRVDAPAPLVAN